MTIRSTAVAVIALCLLAACQQASQPAADQALIQFQGTASGLKVNGQDVPEALVQAYARKVGWELRDPGQRAQVYDKLAELLAVAMEAEKRGLLGEEAVRAELELERLNRLSGLLIERNTPAPTEDELRAAFDRELATTGTEEYQLAHVLLDSAERAQLVLAALNAGASFDEVLAAQAGQAGVRDAKDLGWVRRTQLPPALAEVVAGLAPGTFAPQPVQTEFGFHVAYLRARRPFNAPPYEQVREGIRATLTRQRAAELGQSIVKQARIER